MECSSTAWHGTSSLRLKCVKRDPHSPQGGREPGGPPLCCLLIVLISLLIHFLFQRHPPWCPVMSYCLKSFDICRKGLVNLCNSKNSAKNLVCVCVSKHFPPHPWGLLSDAPGECQQQRRVPSSVDSLPFFTCLRPEEVHAVVFGTFACM